MKKCSLRLFFVWLLLLAGPVWGAPVGEEEALRVVRNWLEGNAARPMEEPLGARPVSAALLRGGPSGDAGYYFVRLEPRGWVLVPADDAYEAILAYGGGELSLEVFRQSPWYACLRVNRMPALRGRAPLHPDNLGAGEHLQLRFEAGGPPHGREYPLLQRLYELSQPLF